MKQYGHAGLVQHLTGARAALELCDSSMQLQVLRLEGRVAARSRLDRVDVLPWQFARLSAEGQQHAQQEKYTKQRAACTDPRLHKSGLAYSLHHISQYLELTDHIHKSPAF